MASSPPSRHGTGLAEGLVFLAFLAVPLAASPRFLDQFTSVKWYVLGAVAAGWLLVERFLCGSRGLPGFVVRTWPGWVALGVLVVVGGLRNGPGWAMEPLLARATFVMLALTAFWYFRRTGLRWAVPRTALAVAAAVVIVLGLLQFAGLRVLPWLTAGDHRSATFGNVNMAAQFAGLALVVLLSGRTDVRRAPIGLGLDVLAGGGLAYVYLAETRSVALALATAGVALLLAGRLPIGPLLRAAAVASMLAWVVLRAAPAGSGPLPSEASGSKELSARMRLAVWSDTLDLIRDHPLGVGAGNFEHAFIPYALAGRSRPGETLFFRSPHNEYLRLLAEEGLAGAALLVALLVLLVRRLHRCEAVGPWRSEPGALLASAGAFLAVEACFQFPFAMAFPTLTAAVLLGLALACVEVPDGDPPTGSPVSRWSRRPGEALALLAAAALLAGVGRLALAESQQVRARGDVKAQERACALDPRRLDSCTDAAWMRARAGEHAAARRLLAGVLGRSPHFFPAIKLSGEVALARGDRQTGCRALGDYDALFGGRSSVSGLLQRECRR